MIDITDLEKRIDHAVAAPIPINMDVGISLETMGQLMEFAKLMAVSGAALPKWLQKNPGGCLAICSRALRWQMDPFAVAEKSYLAIGKGGQEHIGYESQLVHAVVIRWAPLKSRLRTEIIGQGDERRCKVWGTFKGEDKPHEYVSETLGKKKADIGYNDKKQIKGSPLWETDPEVQLMYSAVRQWCRLHSPETLLGVYTPEELSTSEPIDVSPAITSLSDRLREAKKAGARGFDPAHVNRIIEGRTSEAQDESPEGSISEAGSDRQSGRSPDRGSAVDDAHGRATVGEGGQAGGGDAPRPTPARQETKARNAIPPRKPSRR
jgi:hypothetical protein